MRSGVAAWGWVMVTQIGTAGRVCRSCRHWDRTGLCRFNAPSMDGWPSACEVDWCGEWSAPRTQEQANEDTLSGQDPLYLPMKERRQAR